MEHIRSQFSRFLCTTLLATACISSSLFAKEAEIQALPVAVQSAAMAESFLQKLHNQFNTIEMILDSCGQNIATTGKTRLDAPTRRLVRSNIEGLRNDAATVRKSASLHITPLQAHQLALFNEEMISILRTAIDSELTIIPSFDLEGMVTKFKNEDITPEATAQLLKQNDTALARLAADSDQIGLTGVNKAYRSIRKFSKKYYLPQITEHTAVYSAFLVWLIYVTSPDVLEKLPGKPLRDCVAAVKKKVGGTPKTGSLELTNKAQYFVADHKEIDPKTKLEVTHYRPATKYDAPAYAIKLDPNGDGGVEDLTKKLANGSAKLMIPKEGYEPYLGERTQVKNTTKDDDSVISTFTSVVKAFCNVNNAESVFKFTTALLFADYIKKDIEKLGKIAAKQKSNLDDYLFGTAKRNAYDDITVRTERFTDIVGREEVKAELNRIIEYICNPDRYDRAGIKVERGYLLAGKPQTGKTLMAKALAGEISAALEAAGKKQKVRLFEISTDNLAKKGIAYYMELAKTQAPCILFLDELDLLRLQRDGDVKTLSEFLTSMSGSLNSNEKDHVIILAATNKPENVDFALRQHGRFGKMFWFDKPTFKHRAEFFLKECEKRCMDTRGFDFMVLAQQTEGCSFGSLDIVTKKALMSAKQENSPVTQAHFERAIDFEVRKLVPHGYTVPAEKELIVAVRQASKALTSMLLNPAKSLCTVTLLPITQELEEEHVSQQYNIAEIKSKDQRAVRYGGIFAYHLYDVLDIQTQEELIKQCKIHLASNVGQKAFGLASCAFDKADKQEAFKLAKQIVLEGIEPKELAKQVREEKLTHAYRLLEEYEREVEKLLAAHTQELAKIVQTLQKRKTLTIGELHELLGWAPKSANLSAPVAA